MTRRYFFARLGCAGNAVHRALEGRLA